MLHIADIKKYERCPRLFQLSRTRKKEMTPFIHYQENMLELVKKRLRVGEGFVGQVNDDGQLALDALSNEAILFNARFCYEDMRVKIPVITQEQGKRIAYFTYKTCFPKESEAQYIADTIHVLAMLNVVIDELYIIHLNANYVRQGALDVDQLLIVTEYLYNGKNHANHKAFDLVKEKNRDIDEWIHVLHECEHADLYPLRHGSQCTKGIKCKFYDDCYPEKHAVDSILNLVQSQHKYDMHHEGLSTLKQADFNRIEGTRHQYAQIMADQLGGMYVDLGALRSWNEDHIVYPISYLDFEWETFAFPPYDGMKPFDVVTFQYSLHVEDAPNKDLIHVGYIGEGDCRLAFIEHLLANIPNQGSILVYNMEGAEKLRLMQLAKQFPQYEQQLEQIWTRMVDLSLPFATGNVYVLEMAGLYSLKTLVQVFSDCNYNDLDISYGLDAVEKHRQYQLAQGEEKQELYEQLETYCTMDSYAEYIVYHALLKIAHTTE